MKSTLPIFALGTLFLGLSASAQLNPMTAGMGPNGQAPASNAPGARIVNNAPGGIGTNGTSANLKPFATWLLQRLHTISIETYARSISPGTSKNFIAVFSASGAIIHDYEVEYNKSIEDYDNAGRSAGVQIVPYQIQVNTDGSKRLSVTGFGLHDMNALQNSSAKWSYATAFQYIDRIDALTLTWDHESSFEDVRTFDFEFASIGARLGLMSGGTGSYLALRGAGGLGMRWQTTAGNLPLPIMGGRDSSFRPTYTAGVEANVQNQAGLRLNVQSNYLGSRNAVDLVTTEPGALNERESRFVRNSGYLKNSFEISKIVNKAGRPVRLGIGGEYNHGFFDSMRSDDAGSIDMLPRFKQKFTGKLYLTF